MIKFVKCNKEATDENIKESIRNNLYDRFSAIKNFIEALDLIDTNLFISLDAKWGEGKTFYVKQIEMTLKYLSMKRLGQEVDDNLEDVFSKSALKSISIENTYLPIYYNSWLYDYHNDPLMSLLFVLVKECGKYVSTTMDSKSIGNKMLSILSPFSLSLAGVQISGDIGKNKENFTGKDLLEEIKTAEEVRDIVKQILDEIIKESAQKLVIFIDELDRCKPSYAIELLERIKHYFDDDRIIFVVALNKEQLVHTISKFYGEAFDSTGYLNKFFDVNIHLPEIPAYCKENNILQTNSEQLFLRQFVIELSEYYNLSLRDAIIFQQNIEATSKQYYCDYSAQGCMISIFVPLIQVLDIVSQEKKWKFMQGEGEILEELFDNIPSLQRMACQFGNNRTDKGEDYCNGFEKIKNVYDWTFGKSKDYEETMDVSSDLKEVCIRVCNGF